MANTDILYTDVKDAISKLGNADIVVGIPSYNSAETIGHVVRAVSAGLAKYFWDQRSVIVNADGGSRDGTPETVMSVTVDTGRLLLERQPKYPVQRITTPYRGLPGKGSAFRTVFQVAERLGVKACAVVDSDLRSITPEWMDLLLRPVLQNDFDYVAPYYRRHKYDGTITNSIVYPLSRALYGKSIRQPIGGEFGLSRRMVSRLLGDTGVWETDVARYGIDIWMTNTALGGEFEVCQTFLGAKIHDPKDPGADLFAMLEQVVGSLFVLMEETEKKWKEVRGSLPASLFGFPHEVGLEPVGVHLEEIHARFQEGGRAFLPLYRSFLRPPLVAEVERLVDFPLEQHRLEDEVWVEWVYDFAVAFHHKRTDRQQLLRSFAPLYLGWVASFIRRTQAISDREAEEEIEKLCLVYERAKPAFVERWEVG